MRNNTSKVAEASYHSRPRKSVQGRRGAPAVTGNCSDRARWRAPKAAQPTVWESSLEQQISEARAACLRGLSEVPGGLGKLAFLAILQHRLLADHEELFAEWLSCSQQRQYELLHHAVANEPGESQAGSWLNPSVYSALIPASAQKAARAAYLENLSTLLETLKKDLNESASLPARRV
jgi:hypothetical protein